MVISWLRSWRLSTSRVTGLRHIYLRGRTVGRKYQCLNARINVSIDHGCNWNDGDVLYWELEIVVHREASSAFGIYCFGPQKTQFIMGIIERTVIYITQLGCPPLTDISLPAIICTFTCHNMSKRVCALRTAYTLALWLNFHILTLEYAKCPPQPRWMRGVTSPYLPPQGATNKVRLHLTQWW